MFIVILWVCVSGYFHIVLAKRLTEEIQNREKHLREEIQHRETYQLFQCLHRETPINVQLALCEQWLSSLL